jgi:hypothetical protein
MNNGYIDFELNFLSETKDLNELTLIEKNLSSVHFTH